MIFTFSHIKRRFIVWLNSGIVTTVVRSLQRIDRQYQIRQRKQIYNLTDMD